MRTVIAVASHRDLNSGNSPIHDVIETYPEALVASGALPFMIPVEDDSAMLDEYLDMADGLMIPGGIDIDPLLFDQSPDPNLSRIDPLLDHFQIELVRLAVKRGMPVFGICRGIQVINVALGGTLIQHLGNDPKHFGHQQKMPGKWPAHKAESVPGSLIAELFGTEFSVNSFHHQALDAIAPGFRVTAIAPDGVVEAVEHESAWCVGVQWHPERMICDSHANLNLFKRFVAVSAEYRKRKS